MSGQNRKQSAKKGKSNAQGGQDQNLSGYFAPSKPESGQNGSHDAEDNVANMAPTNDVPITSSVLTKMLESQTRDICHKLSSEIKVVSQRMDGIEECVNFHDKELSDLKDSLKNLETSLHEEIEVCKLRQLETACYSRRRNLLLYGLKETKGEDIIHVVRDFFINSLHVSKERVDSIHFINAHRLPRMPRQDGTVIPGPVPVIVKFVSMFDRDLIINAARRSENSQGLRRNRQGVMTDLPPVLKQKCGKLLAKVREMRKAGKYARVNESTTDVFIMTKDGPQGRLLRMAHGN